MLLYVYVHNLKCNSKEPPRRIRLPLAPVDFSLAPVSVALEVDSDLDDFFLSRARYVNTPQSLFEIQVRACFVNGCGVSIACVYFLCQLNT